MVATSGQCSRGEDLVWLIGADGVFACCCRWSNSNCLLARAMDVRNSAAAPLALADQLPLLMTVKRGWSGLPVRCAI